MAMPEIPLIEIGGGAVALAEAEPGRARALLDAGQGDYGRLAMALGDALSRRLLARSRNPYLGELDAIDKRLGRRGVYLLNLSYEWLCTSGVAADPAGAGNRLLRTLDWGLGGLGRHVVVARQEGEAGPYYNITWPGFVGVVTAMAPGRFSAALNQAPMRRAGLPVALDWLRNRIGVWRSGALPPAHLLRMVFDCCTTYHEARTMLRETPLCLPAIFILSGAEAGEGCVIERGVSAVPGGTVVIEAPASAANHWQAPGTGDTPRGVDSVGRLALMESLNGSAAGDGFDWVRPPILNDQTQLAVAANAGVATLRVRGYEGLAPATAIFTL